MTTPTLETHDALLSDGSTTVGLHLVPDRDGVLMRRGPAPPLAFQQFQSLDQQAFNPSQESPFCVKTNHAGFGKQSYVTNRYQAAYGTDASITERIELSPVIVQMTKTTPSYSPSVSIANGDFESGDFTGWTAGTGWSVVNTGTPHGGTWHAKFAVVDSNDHTLSATLTTADCSVFDAGITINIDVWAKRTAGAGFATWTISLYDQAGRLIAFTSMAEAAPYGKVTLTHVFTESSPTLKVVVTANDGSAGNTGYIDDVAVSITGSVSTAANMGSVVKMLDFNGSHYAISDTGLWKQTADNWARVANSPPGITDMATDGTNLYLARGTSKNYWYMSTAEVFTRNTGVAASAQPVLLAWINGSMYGTDNPQTAWKYNDLTSGAVAATYTVGDAGQNFTAVLDHLGYVYFLKQNGAFYNSSGTTIVEVASDLRSLANTNTGKNSFSWRGNGAQTLYIPAGSDSTLLAYDAGDVVNIGPSETQENLTDYQGQIVGTATDDKFAYLCVDNGTKIEIFKSRYATIDGVTSFIHHPFIEDTYGTVVGMHVSSTVTAKRLYWFGGSAVVPKYASLAGGSYATGGTHITPWIDIGLPNVLKHLRSVVLRTTGLAASHQTIVASCRLDGETDWTAFGTYTVSPHQEAFLLTTTNSRRIQFKFQLTTDDAAVTPAILAYTLNYILMPPLLDEIEFTAMVADDNTINDTGDIDQENNYAVVANALRGWKSTIPLTLTVPDGLFTVSDGSHDGEAITCHFAPGYPRDAAVQLAKNGPAPTPQRGLFAMKFFQMRTS